MTYDLKNCWTSARSSFSKSVSASDPPTKFMRGVATNLNTGCKPTFDAVSTDDQGVYGVRFTVSPELPKGITLNSVDGTIKGVSVQLPRRNTKREPEFTRE